MAGNAEQAAWPQPKLQFAISVDGIADDLLFGEVSGLQMDAAGIPYMEGGAGASLPMQLSEVTVPATLTLKHGVFVPDNKFFEWFTQIKMGLVRPRDMKIGLLDAEGEQRMCWRVAHAFPTQISGTDLGSDAEDMAVEELVIAHDGIERLE